MAIEATENWNERIFVRAQTAQRGFLVTGVTTETAALAAVASAFGVVEGASHPQDGRLVVPIGGLLVQQRDGPLIYNVLAAYTTNGNVITGPLGQPADIYPDFQEHAEPVEQDIHGNSITNSSRVSFASPIIDAYTSLTLIISQWESTYDIGKVIAYTQPRATLNSDSIHIPGIGILLAGQLKCRAIKLEAPFRSGRGDPVRMSYYVEARGYWETDNGPVNGFAKRVMDQGRSGFYDDANSNAARAEIVDAANRAVSEDQRLNGKGNPFDDGTTPTNFVYSTTATLRPVDLPDTIGIETTADACWLYYTVNKPMPFSALGWRF
jgi:hypothetical protein